MLTGTKPMKHKLFNLIRYKTLCNLAYPFPSSRLQHLRNAMPFVRRCFTSSLYLDRWSWSLDALASCLYLAYERSEEALGVAWQQAGSKPVDCNIASQPVWRLKVHRASFSTSTK